MNETAGTQALELLPVTSDEDRIGGSLVCTGTESVTTWDADNSSRGECSR
jgi:hypothetical protein